MSGQFFHKKTVRDIPLEGKIVLLRADYNVPLTKEGKIADDYRITSSIPTLKYLLHEKNCSVVIISHLGRPKKNDPHLTLEPIARHLQGLLGVPVRFVEDCVGDKVKVATKNLASGSVMLLENLRYHKGEEENDRDFAARLASDSRAHYFVQDGFGVVHRAHASTDAITHYLPSFGGLLLEKEYNNLEAAMNSPKKPLTAVLGGAKVADKIELIDRFIHTADQIVIGGAMANTFLKYKGANVGKSLVDDNDTAVIDTIYKDVAKKVGVDAIDDFLVLPTDVAVAHSIDAHAKRREVSIHEIGQDDIVLDIGSESISTIEKRIGASGTVIWNGPLGYAELLHFAYSSSRLALHIANHRDITSIIGGGDTADFILNWDKRKGKSFSHISTGGGASLELMSGKKLPGVEALLK